MSKFRKNPVIIDAVKFNACERGQRHDDWDGNLFDKIPKWLKDAVELGIVYKNPKAEAESDYVCLGIKTPEGSMVVLGGDWILKGVNGEIYSCKAALFKKTYQPVKEAVL